MKKLFEIEKFDSYKEDNRRKVKKANGGLPNDMWETYSAYANTYGGVIILGVKELDNKHWKTTGLKATDREKLLDNLWNSLHNPNKVNMNLLTEKDVSTYEVGEDIVIVIEVPMAKRSQKPIYINNDMFNGTYRRTHSGDYKCTRLQVKAMLRDQTENTVDMDILDEAEMSDLNTETVQGYRNRHRTLKAGHPFERLDDAEYLRSIGAAAISKEDKQLHPTAAGMLMFGNEFNIVRHFPEYFLDYREVLDPTIRWTDRLQSSSGEWSGNVCDFYFRVYTKITKDIKIPFKTKGGNRIDDTPVHEALREALANCLINTDFYGVRGVVIRKEPDELILENPGYIRTGKEQMRKGGESDPRNKALMKMFNLINIGERAGSGVPNIFNVWADEGWVEPVIEERFEPDRTILSLKFKKKQAKKTSEGKQAKKTSEESKRRKTIENMEKIREYLIKNGESKASDLAKYLGLSPARTRAILSDMNDVEAIGGTTNRTYRKAD